MYGIFISIYRTFMIFYVYRLTDINTNEFYLGSRSFKGFNIESDNYMGSPHTWKPNKNNLKKDILKSDFNNLEEMLLFERDIILTNINHPLNRNYSIPHPNIKRNNLISAKDENGKNITINIDDPLLGKKYFGVTKGYVVIRDVEGNVFQVDINHPKYLSGEYKHVAVGITKGESHPNWGKLWVNNGIIQKLIPKKNEIEDGWVIGTLQKNKTTNSSHKNTIWVNNGIESIRIDSENLEAYLEKKYIRGRLKLKKYEKRK